MRARTSIGDLVAPRRIIGPRLKDHFILTYPVYILIWLVLQVECGEFRSEEPDVR